MGKHYVSYGHICTRFTEFLATFARLKTIFLETVTLYSSQKITQWIYDHFDLTLSQTFLLTHFVTIREKY